MAGPPPPRYTEYSSKKTETEEMIMKRVMKGILAAFLAMAAIISVQTALAGVLGFHTAELLGKTAVTALFCYSIIRMSRSRRAAEA